MNDGGPAFPQPIAGTIDGMYTTGEKAPENVGMSLRDWFAGKALAGMLACDLYAPQKVLEGCMPTRVDGSGGWGEMFAATAYKYADAMLAERWKARE